MAPLGRVHFWSMGRKKELRQQCDRAAPEEDTFMLGKVGHA
jgi:hypothetical protein